MKSKESQPVKLSDPQNSCSHVSCKTSYFIFVCVSHFLCIYDDFQVRLGDENCST